MTLTINFNFSSVINLENSSESQKASRKIVNIDAPESLSQTSPERFDIYSLFLANQGQYNEIIANYDVVKVYPNLRAVLINISDSERITIEQKFDKTFLMSNLTSKVSPSFNQNTFSNPVVDYTSPSSLVEASTMGVQDLWDLGYTGEGVVVGIVDGGIQENHPGLVGRIQEQVWFEDPSIGTRIFSHGTSVAGLIAGSGDKDSNAKGNAFNSTIIAVALREDAGNYALGNNDEYILAAFEYLIGKTDINIINFSAGAPSASSYMSKIIQRLEESNILLLAAAGNNGVSNSIECPACFIEAVAVASHTGFGPNPATASHSSRGPGIFYGMKPDVSAPGVSIYTTTQNSQYGSPSGTSFATPLTSGALAALISGLNSEGYNWNIGTLKAALIRGAFASSGSTGDYQQGAGAVNISSSYQYLKEQNTTTSFAEGLAVTPLANQFLQRSYLTDVNSMYQGITLITSNASMVTSSLSGNITEILTVNLSKIDLNKYSQYVPLEIDTTATSLGTYSGSLTVSLGDDTVVVELSILVTARSKGNILMDLHHTDWDDSGSDLLLGTNTREMVSLFVEKQYWVEEFHEPLNPTILENYDLLWMPDPFRAVDFEGALITPAELGYIHDFVNSGGSLLIGFNGPYLYSEELGGANASEINKVTGMFGIYSYSDPSFGNIDVSSLNLNNYSSVVGMAETITFAGNYLQINRTEVNSQGASAFPLTGTDGGTLIGTFDKSGAGRVLVTGSNFWMDNEGITGMYDAAGDPVVSANTIDWLLSQNRLTLLNLNYVKKLNQYELTANYTSNHQPTFKIVSASGTVKESQTLDLISENKYHLNFNGVFDATDLLIVSTDSEYLKYDLPLITAININKTDGHETSSTSATTTVTTTSIVSKTTDTTITVTTTSIVSKTTDTTTSSPTTTTTVSPASSSSVQSSTTTQSSVLVPFILIFALLLRAKIFRKKVNRRKMKQN